jgi:hypothetical protein
MCLVGAALALTWLVALLGPSAATVDLPGGGLPYDVGAHPGPALVTALLAVAAVIGAVGVALGWRALRAGWAPSPRRLVAAALLSCVAFVVVPPVTDDDVISYAAYGRIAVLGHDPYRTAPSDLADPVTDAVGPVWRDTPSVYGPIATAEQYVVMRLAGRSLRVGVWLLALVGTAAFATAVLIADRAAATDDDRRRAALLLGLNPVVVIPIVAAAHLDSLLVLAVVAAIALARRRPLLAGAVAGAAFDIKVTGALAVLGIAWWLRRDLQGLARFAIGATVAAVPAYALVGWHALNRARESSRLVSLASPWRWLAARGVSRGLITLGALSLAIALVLLLRRRFGLDRDGPAWPVAVLFLAWVLAAAYVLPWYDGWAWAALALVAARPDVVNALLLHTTALVLAYLPGREGVDLGAGLTTAAKTMRVTLAPALAIVAIALLVARTARRPE